jgi:hypothetical protein
VQLDEIEVDFRFENSDVIRYYKNGCSFRFSYDDIIDMWL